MGSRDYYKVFRERLQQLIEDAIGRPLQAHGGKPLNVTYSDPQPPNSYVWEFSDLYPAFPSTQISSWKKAELEECEEALKDGLFRVVRVEGRQDDDQGLNAQQAIPSVEAYYNPDGRLSLGSERQQPHIPRKSFPSRPQQASEVDDQHLIPALLKRLDDDRRLLEQLGDANRSREYEFQKEKTMRASLEEQLAKKDGEYTSIVLENAALAKQLEDRQGQLEAHNSASTSDIEDGRAQSNDLMVSMIQMHSTTISTLKKRYVSEIEKLREENRSLVEQLQQARSAGLNRPQTHTDTQDAPPEPTENSRKRPQSRHETEESDQPDCGLPRKRAKHGIDHDVRYSFTPSDFRPSSVAEDSQSTITVETGTPNREHIRIATAQAGILKNWTSPRAAAWIKRPEHSRNALDALRTISNGRSFAQTVELVNSAIIQRLSSGIRVSQRGVTLTDLAAVKENTVQLTPITSEMLQQHSVQYGAEGVLESAAF